MKVLLFVMIMQPVKNCKLSFKIILKIQKFLKQLLIRQNITYEFSKGNKSIKKQNKQKQKKYIYQLKDAEKFN